MTQLFANAARAELATTINSTDQALTITSGGGLFPVANTGASAIGPGKDWFKIVVQDDTGYEIIYVRTHTSGSLTFSNLLRGQEGTTARGVTAPAVVGHRMTAGDAQTFRDGTTGLATHTADTDNPHGVTKSQVGLPLVDNVSAASLRDRGSHAGEQEMSTITGLQTALDAKLASGANAASAAKLQTARLIAGKSFDGTADISIAADDVGAAPSSHTHSLGNLDQSDALIDQVPVWSGAAWVPGDMKGGGAGISLDGPATAYAKQTIQYTITDYDIFSSYVVQVVRGTASISGDTITYNAPATAGSETLTIFAGDFQRDIILDILPVGAEQPVNSSPANNATNVLLRPTFSASAFEWFGVSDTHASSDWEIATDTGFTTIVASAYASTSSKTSWTPTSNLPKAQKLYWRVRYNGAANGASQYSTVTGFTTADIYIAAPTITGPASTGIGETPTLTTAAFAVIGPTTDTHASTSWQIRTGPSGSGSVVWQSMSNASNKTSIDVPSGQLVPATLYYLRALHTGTTFGNSAWAEKAFTTASAFLPTVIGEPFGGGFYVGTLDGYVHITAGKAAETSLAWGPTSITTGATSTTDSKSNTNTLVNHSSSHAAAEYCRNYRGGGFDDWDLPAKDVLNLYWVNVPPGGAGTPAPFKTGGAQALHGSDYYWTSTEDSSFIAWFQRFSDGFQNNTSKTSSRLVRPVRRLKI